MNIKNYVFINQLVLKFVGLYPINILRYLVCISCIMLIIVPQIIMIYTNWSDFNVVLETSSTLFTIALATLKSLIWILNRKQLELFIEFMLTDYWKLVQDSVFVYLHGYAIYAKNITKGYFVSMCNALIFFFSLPILEIVITSTNKNSDNFTEKNFPFAATYPTAFYKFPYYEITYMSQILATSICCLIILATDGLIATAVLHTCGHFAVLNKNLKQLNSYIDSTISMTPNSKHIRTDLIEIKIQIVHIVKHHQIILWFCDNMERNFHLMLFLQTMTSSLIICSVGYQVSMTIAEQSKLIKFASHLIVALFQLLLFCFPGDMLINQVARQRDVEYTIKHVFSFKLTPLTKSFSISTAAYSIEWFRLPYAIKDEICMIILRSQKPTYISAGKIYVMHLENFTTILSTAFSYFMMLQSFNSEA